MLLLLVQPTAKDRLHLTALLQAHTLRDLIVVHLLLVVNLDAIVHRDCFP